MKWLGAILVPPGCDCQYSFIIHLHEERHYESEVSVARTQHNVPHQGLKLDCSIRRLVSTLTMRPLHLHSSLTLWQMFFFIIVRVLSISVVVGGLTLAQHPSESITDAQFLKLLNKCYIWGFTCTTHRISARAPDQQVPGLIKSIF